jgi:hypothetical protein
MILEVKVKKVQVSLYEVLEAHRILRRRGPHIFADNRLADGGKVVSLTPHSTFIPRKIPGKDFAEFPSFK